MAFVVKFEKSRHLTGEDALNTEASLGKDEQGKQVWTYKDAELGMSERILVLHAEAPDLNQTEIILMSWDAIDQLSQGL